MWQLTEGLGKHFSGNLDTFVDCKSHHWPEEPSGNSLLRPIAVTVDKLSQLLFDLVCNVAQYQTCPALGYLVDYPRKFYCNLARILL